MKEFLVKIERVTKSSGPNQKTNQRGEQYDSYSYDVEISAGDDMFIVSKFIAVDPGKNPDEVINRINIFPGAIGTMKISSSIGDYTKQNGTMDASVEELTVRWSADVVGSLFMGRFLFADRTVDADMFVPNVVCGLQEGNRHWGLYNKFIMWKIKECRRLSAMPPVFRV